MKSPFPGMDPFIEGCGLWEDFHGHLNERIFDELAARVPERYVVRTGERSYVVMSDENGDRKFSFKPDVALTADFDGDSNGGGTAVAVTEPMVETEFVTMQALVDEEFRETFVEILDADAGGKLVTCIEVLSPANKRPNTPGWELFFRKRRPFLLGLAAHWIEIDLLRGGQRMPMADRWPASPYSVLIAKKEIAPACHVWPAHSRRPIPTIPVPLLKPDPDVPLSIQPMIDAIYARAKYYRSIDYTKTTAVLISPEELAWMQSRLPVASPSSAAHGGPK